SVAMRVTREGSGSGAISGRFSETCSSIFASAFFHFRAQIGQFREDDAGTLSRAAFDNSLGFALDKGDPVAAYVAMFVADNGRFGEDDPAFDEEDFGASGASFAPFLFNVDVSGGDDFFHATDFGRSAGG